MNPNDLFWTSPPEPEVSLPVDPLGLDAMRDELAEHLVPCLTSRTVSHEDFFWTLVFIQWAATEHTHDKRVAVFLYYERCLKLLWAREGRQRRFSGSRRAKEQEQEPGAPRLAYKKLLKLPQSQGMLGAHLAPLRALGLVEKGQLELTDKRGETESGLSLVSAVDPYPPKLRDGNWDSWRRAFTDVRSHYVSSTFRRRLRAVMAEKMPDLNRALSGLGYPNRVDQQWGRAARHMPENLARFAVLAAEFCPWADRMKDFFATLVTNRGKVGAGKCPSPLSARIPEGLNRWEPLRAAIKTWNARDPARFLADWHRRVFEERGYGPSDLWLQNEDGKITPYPGRVSVTENAGGDCRWYNATILLKPCSRRLTHD
jgi:hypothetical protein